MRVSQISFLSLLPSLQQSVGYVGYKYSSLLQPAVSERKQQNKTEQIINTIELYLSLQMFFSVILPSVFSKRCPENLEQGERVLISMIIMFQRDNSQVLEKDFPGL